MDADVAIVGAGVEGLAIASEVAKPGRSVFVFERNAKPGQETSGRSSEVAHAGFNCSPGSLEARFCVLGNRELWRLVENGSIPGRKCGKFVVAVDEREVSALEQYKQQGEKNGVPGLWIATRRYVEQEEPHIRARAALVSLSSGIINSHALVKYFEAMARAKGAEVLCRCEVTGIEQVQGGWSLRVREYGSQTETEVRTRVVINAAGLWADSVAEMAGVKVDEAGLRQYFYKGEYFAIPDRRYTVNHLVYPVRAPDEVGLGIHLTLDLEGNLRAGPNAVPLPSRKIDYTVDPEHRSGFFEAVRRYYALLQDERELVPDYAGIRPRLLTSNGLKRGFYIAHEKARGLPGLIDLLGFESPGLTASPEIGKHVAGMVREILG